MKILIIIPAYNEEKNIERVVDNLIYNYPQYDYIVINDGSKDETLNICKKNNYNVLNLYTNLGLAGAFQAGMIYAYEYGYEYVVQIDGDGQHRVEYIENLIRHAEEKNLDIVIGSRYIEKSKPKTMRMLGSRIISLFIKITTGKKIYDPTSGMRLFDKKVIKEFAHNINYGPEPDTIAFMINNGLEFDEIQVEMDERIEGESYLNLKNSLIYMGRMCISILFVQWVRKRGIV